MKFWKGLISVKNPNSVDIFETITNTFSESLPLPTVSVSCTISPEANDAPNCVSVFDANTNIQVGSIPNPAAISPFNIIINPDGTRIYVSNGPSDQ
jgi:DNA-binding beta-propeller fold protein YncE